MSERAIRGGPGAPDVNTNGAPTARGRGGTGRRTGLKILRPQGCGGSSPPARTNYFRALDASPEHAVFVIERGVCNSCVIASGFWLSASLRMFDHCSPFELVESTVYGPILGMGIAKHHCQAFVS